MPSEEIEIKAKRQKHPDLGTYKPSFTCVENKTLGCFNLKDERTGYLEEAALKGKLSPPYQTKKYSMVEPRLQDTLMRKPAPEKKVPKTNLSPCSYEGMNVFKET